MNKNSDKMSIKEYNENDMEHYYDHLKSQNFYCGLSAIYSSNFTIKEKYWAVVIDFSNDVKVKVPKPFSREKISMYDPIYIPTNDELINYCSSKDTQALKKLIRTNLPWMLLFIFTIQYSMISSIITYIIYRLFNYIFNRKLKKNILFCFNCNIFLLTFGYIPYRKFFEQFILFVPFLPILFSVFCNCGP